MKSRYAIFFTIFALAIPAPGIAEEANCVAAALSLTNGTVGFALGVDEDAVKAKAMNECRTSGAADCQIGFSGKNICISLARATSRNRLGLGAGTSRAQSQKGAMDECAKHGAEGCNIHDTYCAPGSIL